MRSWHPIEPAALCAKHLLGEHFEIHVMWSVLSGKTKGWRNHPETKRWRSHTLALVQRHHEIAEEMARRGFNHRSPLENAPDLTGDVPQPDPLVPEAELVGLLRLRCDDCAKLLRARLR